LAQVIQDYVCFFFVLTFIFHLLEMSKRCIAGLLTGAALGAEGARISRKGASSSGASKELAGVPLLNYDLAYGGRAAQKHEKEHWVVVAKPGVSTAKLEELCRSAKECEKIGHPSEGGVPFFEVHSTEQELEQVLALAPGLMEFAEPDGMIYLDPEESVEAAQSRSWGLDRVDAPNRFATGEGAHIYVLDTGIRVSHSDFGNRASAAIDLTSNSVRECNGESNCGNDAQGHGTHCAGTAGGAEFGVAIGAKLYAGKVLSDQGSGSWSWSYLALDWLATTANSPTISSMSLGGSGTQDAMRRAVDSAVQAGVMVVVAAGNSNSDACFFSPAFVPSAVTVGSTDRRDSRSGFSNFGNCVEIWAPGSDITSAGHRSDTGSATFSGTSMACPHVSGGAALVWGESPTKSPADILADLLARGEQGAITDQRPGDVNFLLWVGSGPAPVPAPTPAPPPPLQCPDFAASRQPDRDGDCLCANRFLCSTDSVSRNCPTSGGNGAYGGRYFLASCESCRCFVSLPA